MRAKVIGDHEAVIGLVKSPARHRDRAVGTATITDDNPASGTVKGAAIDIQIANAIRPDSCIAAGVENAAGVDIDCALGVGVVAADA